MAQPIEDRLENWGRAWRRRANIREAGSAEGAWRSPQPWHDLGAPVTKLPVDILDALAVEHAMQTLDLYHHVLAKCWYVRRWGDQKCLWEARRASGWHDQRRGRGDIAASLAMLSALVLEALAMPAVVRKERARERVAGIVGLPQFLTD